MDTQSLLNHPALELMEKEKKNILIELIQETDGKPMAQALPAILSAQNQLKEKGLAFTKEETSLLMAILTKDLSPSDKGKVEAMKKMMNRSI